MLKNIADNIEQCGQRTLFYAELINPVQVIYFLLCRPDFALGLVSP